MLNWERCECERAESDGRVYTVIVNPHPKTHTSGKPYMALASHTDSKGRLWERIIGFFDNIEQAKYACWNDSKE
jgi:hypothetical protein